MTSLPIFGACRCAPFQLPDGFTIRMNNFPTEALYTLLVEAEQVVDMDELPTAWVMPFEPPNDGRGGEK